MRDRAEGIITKATARSIGAYGDTQWGYLAGLLQAQIRNLCDELSHYEAPSDATYDVWVGEHRVRVKAVWDDDVGFLEVYDVYLRGEDISDLLSDEQIENIARQCREHDERVNERDRHDMGAA